MPVIKYTGQSVKNGGVKRSNHPDAASNPKAPHDAVRAKTTAVLNMMESRSPGRFVALAVSKTDSINFSLTT